MTRPRHGSGRIATFAGLLGLVLVTGAWLRVDGLRWDRGALLHPDERFLAMTVAALDWPASWREYLDESRSPLNPRNVQDGAFVYGTLPLTALKAVGTASGRDSPRSLALIGRVLSASTDLLTLLLVAAAAWLTTRDRRVVWLASACYAFAVLPIQHAHFFVVDPFATTAATMTLVLLMVVRSTRGRGTLVAWAGAGAAFGLAVACKLPMVLLAVPMAAVWIERAWHTLVARRGRERTSGDDTRTLALAPAIAALAALVAVRVAMPDAFVAGWWPWPAPRWLADLQQVRQLTSGAIEVPPSLQWAGRVPLLNALWNLTAWGLGLPLGLAAWAGVAWAGRRLVVEGDARWLAPLAWIAVVISVHGTAFVHTLRYFLPIVPMLALLAAAALVRQVDWAAARSARWHRGLAWVLLAGVGLSTVSWAVAFTSIYRHLHPRIAASAWIYRQVPPPATIVNEHWDDGLPLRVRPTRPQDDYRVLVVESAAPDTPEKRDLLIDLLEAADIVVLSSDRHASTLPRLPERFPLMFRYYRALASGELGFELAAEFRSVPSLGPIRIDDLEAEEAFTVYDHPRVRIYRKSSWTRDRGETVFGDIEWDALVPTPARDVARLPRGLALGAEARRSIETGGTWSRTIDPDRGLFATDGSTGWRVVRWIVLVEGLGWLAWPLIALAVPRTRGFAAALARPVGLLLVGWFAWLGTNLGVVGFTPAGVRWSLVALALAAFACAATTAARRRLRRLARCTRSTFAWQAAIFWGAFGAALVLRAGNPDLWHPYTGGEKPMDLALLNALIRTEQFPPYDPWFAGGVLNYYYFGFTLVAILVKLAAVPTPLAYALAVATFYAFTATAVFGVAALLVSCVRPGRGTHARRRAAWFGLVAAGLAVVAGNLAQVPLAGRALWSWLSHGTTGVTLSQWYWSATRPIPHLPNEAPPIAEFPFFTFLFGDLHAHMMGMPFVVAAAGLALVLSRSGPRWPALALACLVVGATAAINTWDTPTAIALVAIGLVAHGISREPWTAWPAAAARALVIAALVLGTAFVLFLPFHLAYGAAYTSLTVWRGSRTTPLAHVAVHGLFLVVLVPWLWQRLRRSDLFDPPRARARLVTLGLAGLAFALTLLVEVVALRGDVGRMNTVFKFYVHVWLLWSIASGAALADLLARPTRDAPGESLRLLRRRWALGMVLAVWAGGLAYPLTATPARWRDRFEPAAGWTLDGAAFMRTARHTEQGVTFALADDLAAIEWLKERVRGTPTVLEARTAQYRWGGRISAHTGLPTLMGWEWHVRQQRAALPRVVIARRARDIRRIYDGTDVDEAARLLARHRVAFVVVGALERAIYTKEGLAKFSRQAAGPWRLVFEQGTTEVYAVDRFVDPDARRAAR